MHFLRGLNWKQVVPIVALALIVGGFGGFFLHKALDTHTFRSFRDAGSGYTYISPLLFVSIDEAQAFPKYSALKDAMKSFADTAKREGRVEDISIYFRNLNTSQWTAVNPEERYSPASMFKVATLIAALDVVQNNPSVMQSRARIDGVLEEDETQKLYPPENPILPGNSYSVEELLTHMIQESDNVANLALTQFAGEERIQKVYEELELLPSEDVPGEGYTAQEYSRLYRTLYNSTYLSRSYSEYALSLLADTDFTAGIVAGVPSGVKVAHKFGVRADDTSETKELHDCGIVYYNEGPYFVCVMTRGTDLSVLESVLGDASRVVWEGVLSVPE